MSLPTTLVKWSLLVSHGEVNYSISCVGVSVVCMCVCLLFLLQCHGLVSLHPQHTLSLFPFSQVFPLMCPPPQSKQGSKCVHQFYAFGPAFRFTLNQYTPAKSSKKYQTTGVSQESIEIAIVLLGHLVIGHPQKIVQWRFSPKIQERNTFV